MPLFSLVERKGSAFLLHPATGGGCHFSNCRETQNLSLFYLMGIHMKREDTLLLLKIEDLISNDPIRLFCEWYSSQVGNYGDMVEFLKKRECDHIPDPIKSKLINGIREIQTEST